MIRCQRNRPIVYPLTWWGLLHPRHHALSRSCLRFPSEVPTVEDTVPCQSRQPQIWCISTAWRLQLIDSKVFAGQSQSWWTLDQLMWSSYLKRNLAPQSSSELDTQDLAYYFYHQRMPFAQARGALQSFSSERMYYVPLFDLFSYFQTILL